MNLLPGRLERDPPSHNTVCKRLETVERQESTGVSMAGPPPDCIGPVTSGEHAMDMGIVGAFKFNVILE